MSGNAYRDAARQFWPDHADTVYDLFDAHNAAYFDGRVPMRGIIVGLTPHGGRLGHTDPGGLITVHPSVFLPSSPAPWGRADWGPRATSDLILHEMVHALLFATGEDPDHNGLPWCREVARISPLIGLGTVVASPWKRARESKDDGGRLVYRPTVPGSVPRAALADWPRSLRPADYYRD